MPKTHGFQQLREYVARLELQSILYRVGSVQAGVGDIVLGLTNTASERGQAVEVCGGCLSDQVFNANCVQVEKWRALVSLSENPTIYLHSLSYDSVLAFVLLLLRCKTKQLDIGLLQPWVDVANDSKQGLFARIGKPDRSMYWLINALGHGFLEASDGIPNATRFAKGFLKTVDLLLVGLERDAPVHDVLDKLGNYPVLLEALAFNRLASQRYEKIVATGDCLQWLLPVASGNRRMLVDVLLASDKRPLGDVRAFALYDDSHPWRKAGFSVIASHQLVDSSSAQHYQFSIAVLDTNSGISLAPAVEPLQTIENTLAQVGAARWVADYDGTLLRPAKDGQPSKLSWNHDVLPTLWRSFHPGFGLQFRSWRGSGTNALTDPTTLHHIQCHTRNGKIFSAVQWSSASSRDELPSCPTFDRLLLAFVLNASNANNSDGIPLPSIDQLPASSSIQKLDIPGGFILVHQDAILILDDWTKSQINVEAYYSEFANVTQRFHAIENLSDMLPQLDHGLMEGLATDDNRFDQWVEKITTAKLKLSAIHAQTLARATGHHVQQFRSTLENAWGVGEQLTELSSSLEQIHDALQISFKLRHERAIFKWQRLLKAVTTAGFIGVALHHVVSVVPIPETAKISVVLGGAFLCAVIVWLFNSSRHRQIGSGVLDNFKSFNGG